MSASLALDGEAKATESGVAKLNDYTGGVGKCNRSRGELVWRKRGLSQAFSYGGIVGGHFAGRRARQLATLVFGWRGLSHRGMRAGFDGRPSGSLGEVSGASLPRCACAVGKLARRRKL